MTNKIVLRDLDQFMADFTPTYVPLMPTFLAKKSVQYKAEAGKVTFRRAQALGDLRSKRVTPKDTELKQISSKEDSKVFKKYFFGSQYVQSNLQDTQGYEDVIAQVLDEHNRQSDIIFLGDRDASGNIINSGLFYSEDSNYQENSSAEIAAASAGYHLPGLYSKIVSEVEAANDIDGEKLVLLYGSTMIEKANQLFANTDKPFMQTLRDGAEFSRIQKMPSSITPAGNGFLVVNLDQIKTHYTNLPQILDQGVNSEKMYTWTNFLMGSSMVECLTKGAIRKQPLTFA